jgi:hypothetical protein
MSTVETTHWTMECSAAIASRVAGQKRPDKMVSYRRLPAG